MSRKPISWTFRKKGSYCDIDILSGDKVIARVFEHGENTADANAKLIAEALQFALERLKIVERESDYDHRTFHQGIAIDKAIAAINKAKGEKK